MRTLAPIVLATAICCASTAQAAPWRESLVAPDWAAKHLADKDLVILHAGDDADYAAGHLPGAQLVKRDGLSVNGPGGLMLEMPTEPELRAQLQRLGISDHSRILVYAGTGEIQGATRLMYTLDAAGLGDRASLLDGGLAGWKASKGATTTVANLPVAPGVLAPLKLEPRAVTAEWVAENAKVFGYKVIDARAPVFYDGLQAGFGASPSLKGHIPGAVSLPFTSVTAADHRLKSPAELRALFAAAGVKPGDKVAVYCHVGQQATAVQFAAREVGIDANLYDGSFQDWAQRKGAVETAAPGPVR